MGECPIPKPSRYAPNDTKEAAFRSSAGWTRKSLHIRQRDKFLCQACRYGLADGVHRITTEQLEVHHITPINAGWDDRLDDYNLITLCRSCHEMAERGRLDTDKLRAIAKANTDSSE